MAPALKRIPLGAREVEIMRRLHRVIGVPVTKIALAVNRNKSTVYDAWAFGPQGERVST